MAVEAIWFTYFKQPIFNKEAMKNMKRLRILCIHYGEISYLSDSNCHDGPIEYLPNNLRWFVWHDYPWKSLPENFKPQRLVHLDLRWSSLYHLWNETKILRSLRTLDLSGSKRLIRTPDFTGMPNLECLNLEECTSLEEVHPSLECCKKLKRLNLYNCEHLERFPYVNVESLEYLNIEVRGSGIRELPPSIFQHQTHLTELDLKEYFGYLNNLVSLPSSICMLKGLVKLYVSYFSKLESLPEEIGDLENLEELDARYTLISRPPPSIIRLNKLKFLSFGEQKSEDGVFFVFPLVNEGLRSLEILNLNYCNLLDGGLPEDIGCLSSLKKLYLKGNNFEHLPRSIAQLGALQSLDLRDCKRLKQLPEFPEQLHTIYADWRNDWICNSLFQNISSITDISASDSLSLRLFTSWFDWEKNIPSWFHHRGMDRSVSVNLPENWYIRANFLGFAVCCSAKLIDIGKLIDITAHLIPLCDDGMSSITLKLALYNPSKRSPYYNVHFFLLPFACLWDTSKANGKTPNDYGCIILSFSEELEEFGLRLLYKHEPELEALLQMRENNSRENGEVSCSSSKKQRLHF